MRASDNERTASSLGRRMTSIKTKVSEGLVPTHRAKSRNQTRAEVLSLLVMPNPAPCFGDCCVGLGHKTGVNQHCFAVESTCACRIHAPRAPQAYPVETPMRGRGEGQPRLHRCGQVRGAGAACTQPARPPPRPSRSSDSSPGPLLCSPPNTHRKQTDGRTQLGRSIHHTVPGCSWQTSCNLCPRTR